MESEKTRGARRKGRIVFITLIIIVMVIAVIAFIQKDNISALLMGVNNSQEEIDNEIKKNQENFAKVADEYDILDRELTDEELAQLESGEKTIDDFASDMVKPSSGQQSSDPSNDAEVKKFVASLYVLRSSYNSRINGLMSSAKSEYAALPEEQKTDTAKRRIISSKISEASSLESECDAKVNSVISQLKGRLKELGQSTSLADEIMNTYESEKQLRKASYISMYT